MMFSSQPQLPEHCKPRNDFLTSISLTFNSCIPTPLALISTILGVLSILSWLFAQVPQIIKNFNLRSTSGLSAFFLGEWLLGDLSNLLGSLFTGQATWQVVLALYYCCVDCVLCGQWLWYEQLKHGRKVRRVRWWRKSRAIRDEESRVHAAKQQPPAVKVNGVPIQVPKSKPIASRGEIPGPGFSPAGTPAGTPSEGSSWIPSSIFSRPQFASNSSVSSTPDSQPSTPTRPIIRVPRPQSPTPSPRTVLYITLLICLAARANPTSTATALLHVSSSPHISSSESAIQSVGTIFSWLSTILYLASRLPQLLHNASRRSTEGLSASLFLAAFFGNLFYSTSLLTNPSLWHNMPAYGGGGWADQHGSDRLTWATRAAPFFLGAAGVLLLDALVGLQFMWYAKTHLQHGSDDEASTISATAPTTSATAITSASEQQQGQRKRKRETSPAAVLVVETEGVRGAGRWRKVSGWMRGWTPVAASSWRRDSLSSMSDDYDADDGGGGGGGGGAINRHLDIARDGRPPRRRRSSAYNRNRPGFRNNQAGGAAGTLAERTNGVSESDRLLGNENASDAARGGSGESYGSLD